MIVQAFLADSAEAVQGKLYVLGAGWNVLFSESFPFTHNRVAVGIVVEVPYTATNEMHTISVNLQDEDGQVVTLGMGPGEHGGEPRPITQLGGQFNVGRPPLLPHGDSQPVPFAMQIDGLTFERPGMFAWVIKIDEEETGRLPMRVVLPPQGGTLR